MRVQAIIPTIPGREESLTRLLDSLPGCVEPLVRMDSPTCGAGWHEGIADATADYVLLACDDQEFLNEAWVDLCIATVEQRQLPCPRVWRPDGTIESQGGDMNVLHHIIGRPQRDGTQVDYTTIPFLSLDAAREIGMPPELHYCSDVWISYRGAQLGWETVLRHGYDVRHWREDHGRGAGMDESSRDALDEARMRKELARCGSSPQAA